MERDTKRSFLPFVFGSAFFSKSPPLSQMYWDRLFVLLIFIFLFQVCKFILMLYWLLSWLQYSPSYSLLPSPYSSYLCLPPSPLPPVLSFCPPPSSSPPRIQQFVKVCVSIERKWKGAVNVFLVGEHLYKPPIFPLTFYQTLTLSSVNISSALSSTSVWPYIRPLYLCD